MWRLFLFIVMDKQINILDGKDLEFVEQCIRNNNVHAFYTWDKWRRLRRQVLEMDKYECQHCKQNGVYTKANTVHHVNELKKVPSLALSMYYSMGGKTKRNLVSLCHACHEKAHGYRKPKPKSEPLTVERWD